MLMAWRAWSGAFVDVGLDDGHQAAVRTVEGVALLGDGEGDHLQAGIGEDLLEAGHHGRIGGIGAQTLGHRTDDLTAGGAVGVQGDHHGQVVVGGVDLVDDVVVEGVGCDDAAVGALTGVEQLLLQRRNEAAEDVAGAEVHQMGWALVAAVMASWSNRGSLTPSFSHSAFWLTMEEAFICIVIDSFCLTARWAVIMPSALISVYRAIFIRKMAEIA